MTGALLANGREGRPTARAVAGDGHLDWRTYEVLVRFGEVPRGTARVSLVPWPVEIGDEVTVEAHPWPVEVVDLVWAPAGAKVAALVKVRPAVLHPA
jgi:hypothetical protein